MNKEMKMKIKEYFGLNVYQTKVWIALLSRGIASAREIAEISRVPRSRTYDVLESLEKKGFAIRKLGKPTEYLAVDPKKIIEKLKRYSYNEAEKKAKTLDKLEGGEEFDKLENLYNKFIDPVKKKKLSGLIKGKSDIFSHSREIISKADKRVIICMQDKELLENEKSLKDIIKKLRENEVEIKIVFSGNKENKDRIEESFSIEPTYITIESKFILVDDERILFSLNNPEDGRGVAMWLESSFISEAFSTLFETYLDKRKE